MVEKAWKSFQVWALSGEVLGQGLRTIDDGGLVGLHKGGGVGKGLDAAGARVARRHARAAARVGHAALP